MATGRRLCGLKSSPVFMASTTRSQHGEEREEMGRSWGFGGGSRTSKDDAKAPFTDFVLHLEVTTDDVV